jgi:superfamily I DNA/RNA helicase
VTKTYLLYCMLIVRASPVSRNSNKKSSSSSSTPPPSVSMSCRQGLALFLDCMALTDEAKNDMLMKNASSHSSSSSSSSSGSSGSISTNEQTSRGHRCTDNTADDTNNDDDDDDDFQAVRTPVVQLMTIHKSKGLEFDAVVLCGMEEGGYYE